MLADATWKSLFLTADDLMAGMQPDGPAAPTGVNNDDDPEYAAHGGVRAEMMSWRNEHFRCTDIRDEFPDAAAATAYHLAALERRAEGAPPLDAPSIGANCRVFGGRVQMLGLEFTNYFYLFTTGPVAAKLYVADTSDRGLMITDCTMLALRIVQRAAAAGLV